MPEDEDVLAGRRLAVLPATISASVPHSPTSSAATRTSPSSRGGSGRSCSARESGRPGVTTRARMPSSCPRAHGGTPRPSGDSSVTGPRGPRAWPRTARPVPTVVGMRPTPRPSRRPRDRAGRARAPVVLACLALVLPACGVSRDQPARPGPVRPVLVPPAGSVVLVPGSTARQLALATSAALFRSSPGRRGRRRRRRRRDRGRRPGGSAARGPPAPGRRRQPGWDRDRDDARGRDRDDARAGTGSAPAPTDAGAGSRRSVGCTQRRSCWSAPGTTPAACPGG